MGCCRNNTRVTYANTAPLAHVDGSAPGDALRYFCISRRPLFSSSPGCLSAISNAEADCRLEPSPKTESLDDSSELSSRRRRRRDRSRCLPLARYRRRLRLRLLDSLRVRTSLRRLSRSGLATLGFATPPSFVRPPAVAAAASNTSFTLFTFCARLRFSPCYAAR